LLRNNEDPSIRERTCVLLLHMTRLNPNCLLEIWHQTLTNDIEFLKSDPCQNVVQVHTNQDYYSFLFKVYFIFNVFLN